MNYTAIFDRNKIILSTDNRFNQVIFNLMTKLDWYDVMKQYKPSESFDNDKACLVIEEATAYLVTANPEFPSRICFNYLLELRGNFSLDHVLRINKKYSDKNIDQIMKIQKDLDETRELMKKNIDKLLTRGDNIEQLSVTTEDIKEVSFLYKKEARKLKWYHQWKRCYWMIVLTIVFFVIFIISGVVTYLVITYFL